MEKKLLSRSSREPPPCVEPARRIQYRLPRFSIVEARGAHQMGAVRWVELRPVSHTQDARPPRRGAANVIEPYSRRRSRPLSPSAFGQRQRTAHPCRDSDVPDGRGSRLSGTWDNLDRNVPVGQIGEGIQVV